MKLVHPLGTLIFGLVTFGFFAALAICSIVLFAGETAVWLVTPIFLCLALLCASNVIAFFTDKQQVSADGLQFTPFFRGPVTLLWRDVKSVRYVHRLRWFRIEGPFGSVARISVMLTGLPEFARLLLNAVPERVIEPAAAQILKETAAGSPPSPW